MPPLTEAQFATQIMQLARTLGYMRYHTWLSRHSAAGHPDELLVRPPRALYAELKAETGKPSPPQIAWLDALTACGLEVHLWRPSMIDAIAAHLAHPARPGEPGPGAWVVTTAPPKPQGHTYSEFGRGWK